MLFAAIISHTEAGITIVVSGDEQEFWTAESRDMRSRVYRDAENQLFKSGVGLSRRVLTCRDGCMEALEFSPQPRANDVQRLDASFKDFRLFFVLENR